MEKWDNTTTSTETNDKLVPCKYCKCLILPTIAKCPSCNGEQV